MKAAHAIAALAFLSLSGCAPVTWIGLRVLYRRTDLPVDRVVKDICYTVDPCNGNARRLDLYLPEGKNWPVLIFVHGGNWDEGDKQLTVGSADVYANIGRFYAKRGIGTAVINYRLQPETDWHGQVDDVRASLVWAQTHIASYGGDAQRIFLMGHSAGTHLASYVAVALEAGGKKNIKGVIAVSGAALDLTDQKTYDMGEDVRFYEKRFQGRDTTQAWKGLASPATHATSNAPPFLVMCAGGEKKTLQRQSACLSNAISNAGVESKLVTIPGESHSRMVLVLSRADKMAVPEILKFIENHK